MTGISLTSDPGLDDLIRAAQSDPSDDTQAMADILERFAPRIAATAKAVAGEWNTRQDAAQGARLGLVKAVRKHALGTPGFKTFANRYMRTEAVRTIKVETNRHERPDSTNLESRRSSVVPDLNWNSVETPAFTIDSISTFLDSTQASILRDRYVRDRRLADIALDLGVSVPAVSQRLKTIHKVLEPILVEAVAA